MTTLSFENLDFSVLIEVDNRIAYLQEWEDGNWSEPVKFGLPQPTEALVGPSKLASAVKSFRRETYLEEFRDALTHGASRLATEDFSHPLARFWNAIQASCRQLATSFAKPVS